DFVRLHQVGEKGLLARSSRGGRAGAGIEIGESGKVHQPRETLAEGSRYGRHRQALETRWSEPSGEHLQRAGDIRAHGMQTGQRIRRGGGRRGRRLEGRYTADAADAAQTGRLHVTG